jgi:hypothetical protein
VTDQELADAVHEATAVLNKAVDAALAAGLRVSVERFSGGRPLVSIVDRLIPAQVTLYPPSGADRT